LQSIAYFLGSRRVIARRLVKGPAEFRQQLQQRGPTFIKMGQFLALRPDLIPQAYCDELMHLFDQVPPFSWEQARAILKEDLLAEPTELFAYINPRPVASGSLAQTHLARLKNGTEVAVKIQRPNIQSQVLRDLSHTRLLTRVLDSSGATQIAPPQDIIHELTEWMLREVDFSNELTNLTRLYRLTADSSIQKVPQPYPHLCTNRVITLEFLHGVPFSELLLQLRSDDSPLSERLGVPDIDPNRLAENLIIASFTQIFRYQFFHADLHPGNLLALPGNVIGFVDFGLCDELADMVRERQMHYISAVFSNDAEQMFSALTEILIPDVETDINAFRRDFLVEVRTSTSRKPTNGQFEDQASNAKEPSPIVQAMVGVMRVARQHKLRVPPRILSMYRTLFTAETVAYQLGADVDLRLVGREFFRRSQVDETLRILEPADFQSFAMNLLALGRDAPGQIQQILTELSDGRFALNVYASESSRIVRDRNRRVRLLVTAILSVSVTLLLARPTLPELFGISLAWPLAGVLVLLYIWIFIQWRQLR
jgi:ubiquinone biosynthesis protein